MHLLHNFGGASTGIEPQELGYTGVASDGGSVLPIGTSFGTNESAFAISTPFSLEVWFWPARVNTEADLVDIGVPSGFRSLIGVDNTGHPFCAPTTTGTLTASTPINRFHWHYLVATFDGSTARLYVDAILSTSHAMNSQATTNMPRWVAGSSQSLNANIPLGFVTEAAVYLSTLSPTQINNHFLAADNVTTPVYTAPIIQSGGGSTVALSSQIADILAAVQRTFPTT